MFVSRIAVSAAAPMHPNKSMKHYILIDQIRHELLSVSHWEEIGGVRSTAPNSMAIPPAGIKPRFGLTAVCPPSIPFEVLSSLHAATIITDNGHELTVREITSNGSQISGYTA